MLRKGKREKATKTRRTKEAVWDFATDMLFPPKAIIDVFRAGNKRNIAKELAKFLKEHRKVDDYYNKMSFCYDVIIAAAIYALNGIKKEWKEYFDTTIDIVQKDDRAIKKMIEDEKNKIFIYIDNNMSSLITKFLIIVWIIKIIIFNIPKSLYNDICNSFYIG